MLFSLTAWIAISLVMLQIRYIQEISSEETDKFREIVLNCIKHYLFFIYLKDNIQKIIFLPTTLGNLNQNNEKTLFLPYRQFKVTTKNKYNQILTIKQPRFTIIIK